MPKFDVVVVQTVNRVYRKTFEAPTNEAAWALASADTDDGLDTSWREEFDTGLTCLIESVTGVTEIP